MNLINLLPAKQTLAIKWCLVITLLGSGMILLGWHLMLHRQLNLALKQRAYLHHKWQLLMTTRRNATNSETQQQLHQTLQQTVQLEQQRLKFAQIFELLQQGVREDLYLTQLGITSQEITIVGHARSMLAITQLLTHLSTAKHSGTPLIQKITRQQDGYDFSLSWPYRRT